MKKIFFIIFFISLFLIDEGVPSKAASIDLSKVIKIETAAKGQKLKEFFSDNTLFLSFEGKKKEYRFQPKKYEVFEDGKLIESGKWKVSGILKNSIRLKAENKKKYYYFKKINKKPIIYHYNKPPGSEDAIKTLVEIEEPNKITEKVEPKVVEKKEEPKVEETKVVEKKETKKKEKKKSSKSLLKIGENLNKGISKILGGKSSESKDTRTENNENKIQKHLLEKFRATSNVSYYFFEASLSYLQSLELLYRAYDNNTEADKLSNSIDYLKNSKSSESERLRSTKSIIGTSSIKIQSNIQDASYILNEKGRGYYEQSLPFALGAAESTISLYNSSRLVLQNIGLSGGLSVDSLLYSANDLAAIITVLPEIPGFSKDMMQTIKLIFSGAREKKIRDQGKYSKALAELNLSDFDDSG